MTPLDTLKYKDVARLVDKIRERSIDRLYLVENVQQCHWIVIRVEFNLCTISSGDSLRNFHHMKVLEQSLQSILEKNLGEHFNIGQLEAPEQKDLFSCGVCAASTIQHDLFSDPYGNRPLVEYTGWSFSTWLRRH